MSDETKRWTRLGLVVFCAFVCGTTLGMLYGRHSQAAWTERARAQTQEAIAGWNDTIATLEKQTAFVSGGCGTRAALALAEPSRWPRRRRGE